MLVLYRLSEVRRGHRADTKRAAVPQVAIYSHPWQQRGALWNVLCGAYVLIFSVYWVGNLAHLVAVDLRALAEVRHFCNHKLGLSERQLQTVTWPEVVHRIVQVSSQLQALCYHVPGGLMLDPSPHYRCRRPQAPALAVLPCSLRANFGLEFFVITGSGGPLLKPCLVNALILKPC